MTIERIQNVQGDFSFSAVFNVNLGFEGKAASTAADSSTNADAFAVRRVACLALTSTMLAWPASLKCESCESSGMALLK